MRPFLSVIFFSRQSAKLLKETQIVLEQQTDIADFMPCGGQAVKADTKGKPAVNLRVYPAARKDVGVYHAGAQYFYPSRVLANTAALPAAFAAAYVHLNTRLGEREK
jgi:hypothetical protein